MPEANQFNMTKDQLEFLGNAIKDQEQKVENLTQSLAPLSPSGSIPGMNPDVQYNNSDLLDIDSIFNSGDYFNDHPDNEHVNFDNDDLPNFNFDGAADSAHEEHMQGLDGAADERSERGSGVETLGSSEVASPANTQNTVDEQEDSGRGKRRKPN